MADTSKVVKQFLGDDKFPVKWDSEAEKQLFWVYDDLHCPHPLSPMYFDIGGWWLTCDHMFRRFGTPFAADWIAKNINGYLYTARHPGRRRLHRGRRGVRQSLRGPGAHRRSGLSRQDRRLPGQRAAGLRP